MVAETRAYGPTRYQVADHFERISRELRATDRRLEHAEYNRTEPGHNWAGWFRDAASDMRRATRAFADVTDRGYGSATGDVIRRLDRVAYDLDGRGREVARMDRYNQRFGYGWGSVLDGAIDTVDDALRLLTRRY